MSEQPRISLCLSGGGFRATFFHARSLRAGHVTESLARGAGRASVKRRAGHASDTMLDRYDREADPAADNSSAALGF
jgi:integrase